MKWACSSDVVWRRRRRAGRLRRSAAWTRVSVCRLVVVSALLIVVSGAMETAVPAPGSCAWVTGAANVCGAVSAAVGAAEASVADEAEHEAANDDGWRVVVVDVETGNELWSVRVRTGEEVVYMYTHSADKTPVESLLRVEPPPVGLVLVRERYLWYGAGLEYRSDRGVVLDGEWVVVEAERAIGSLVLRVAGTVEQRVAVGAEETTLGRLASFGQRVKLEVRP